MLELLRRRENLVHLCDLLDSSPLESDAQGPVSASRAFTLLVDLASKCEWIRLYRIVLLSQHQLLEKYSSSVISKDLLAFSKMESDDGLSSVSLHFRILLAKRLLSPPPFSPVEKSSESLAFASFLWISNVLCEIVRMTCLMDGPVPMHTETAADSFGSLSNLPAEIGDKLNTLLDDIPVEALDFCHACSDSVFENIVIVFGLTAAIPRRGVQDVLAYVAQEFCNLVDSPLLTVDRLLPSKGVDDAMAVEPSQSLLQPSFYLPNIEDGVLDLTQSLLTHITLTPEWQTALKQSRHSLQIDVDHELARQVKQSLREVSCFCGALTNRGIFRGPMRFPD